jgi:hypothetical protein
MSLRALVEMQSVETKRSNPLFCEDASRLCLHFVTPRNDLHKL